MRRLAGAEPGPGGIPANAKKHENSLKCRKWTPFPLAKARAGSDPVAKAGAGLGFDLKSPENPGKFFHRNFFGAFWNTSGKKSLRGILVAGELF